MLKMERFFTFLGFMRRREAALPSYPQAWVWEEYQAQHTQTKAELAQLYKPYIPMAWVWCHYRAEFPQTSEEKWLTVTPRPSAWVWTAYQDRLSQSDAERIALNAYPIPMGWVWSYYRGVLPQSSLEKEQADRLVRFNDSVVKFRKKPQQFYPQHIAASLAVGFTGLVLLFQAVVMNSL